MAWTDGLPLRYCTCMAGTRTRRSGNGQVCTCLLVGRHEVLATIRAGARTLAEVGEGCEAGTGCTSCHAALEAILADERTRRERIRARKAGERPQLGLFTGAPGETP